VPQQDLIKDIRESFDLRKVSKRTSVLLLAVMSFTLLSIRYAPIIPYVFMFLAFIAGTQIHHQVTGKDILAYRAWEIRNIWKPILIGVTMSVAFYVPALTLSGWRVKGSFHELFLPTFAWVVVVATVEEFGFRFVMLRAFRPYSIITANVMFAVLHPVVWDSLSTGNVVGFYFFMGYLGFGALMTLAVVFYDQNDGKGINGCFGPIWAIAVHGAHNFFLTVFGPVSGTTQLVPMSIFPEGCNSCCGLPLLIGLAAVIVGIWAWRKHAKA